jgi:hypothetical protein
LFNDVGSPATGSRDNKERGEEFCGDAALVVSTGGVEVKIREHFLFFDHKFFDSFRNFKEGRFAILSLRQFLGVGFDDIISRIAIFIDTVTKAHDKFL